MTKCVLFVNGNYLPLMVEDIFVSDFEAQLKEALSSKAAYWEYMGETSGIKSLKIALRLDRFDGYFFIKDDPSKNLAKRQVEVAERAANIAEKILGKESEGDDWKKVV